MVPGGRIPGEADLAIEFDAARSTVNKALHFRQLNANEWLVRNAPYPHAELMFSAENANRRDARLLDRPRGRRFVNSITDVSWSWIVAFLPLPHSRLSPAWLLPSAFKA